MSVARSRHVDGGTLVLWVSVTDPEGGCDPVEVAVVADTFAHARELATAAGYDVTGRKPRERLPEALVPQEAAGRPGVVFVRTSDRPPRPWRPAQPST